LTARVDAAHVTGSVCGDSNYRVRRSCCSHLRQQNCASKRADRSTAACSGLPQERCHLPELVSGAAGPEKAWTFADAPLEDDDDAEVDALESDWMLVGLPSVEPCDEENTASTG